MPMNWLEHFCDDRRHQVLTSIRIWARSKENQTFQGTLSKRELRTLHFFFLFQGTIQPDVPATIPALPKNVVKESVAKNDIPTGKVLQKKMSKIYVKIIVAAQNLKDNHNFHMQYIHIDT